ncbi:MAG TPA: glycosyltransferase [Anaeromyxobacter sp.]
MRLCAISYKECWQDASGAWMSSGGFPLQMAAIASLFDEVTLVIGRGTPRAGGVPLPPAARVVALPPPSGTDFRRKLSLLAKTPAYLRELARHIRQADVVHTPLPGDIPLLGFLVAVLLRKRVIARYGSSWDTNSQTTVGNRVTRGLLRALAGGRRVILATGGGPSEPGRRVHWIFATALSRAEIDLHRPDLDRRPGSPARLLTIGRLSPEKGVDVLLRALAGLSRRGREVSLTLAGDGPERARLEALAEELGIADRVRFAGQLAREELGREIAAADLCVAPSRTEGFSKAWLDAFVGGLPVLATQVGAAAAAVGADGERGWLVPPGDHVALAAALERILDAPLDWPALRRRCREFVAARTLESWAGRIGELCAAQWRMTLAGGKLRA